MTQEDKELLLKDLCARIPYGVKCNAVLKQIDGSLKSVYGTFKGYNGWATVGNNLVDIETVRPYLRLMSSMTYNEKLDYILRTHKNWDKYDNEVRELTIDAVDWLNGHHFDYRGLIEQGLALEASEGMYNIK